MKYPLWEKRVFLCAYTTSSARVLLSSIQITYNMNTRKILWYIPIIGIPFIFKDMKEVLVSDLHFFGTAIYHGMVIMSIIGLVNGW